MDIKTMRIALFLLTFFVTPSFAAKVAIAPELLVQSINGTPVTQSLFSTTDSITLEQGNHTLAFVYKDVYESDYDDHDVITSESFTLALTIDDENADYAIEFARPETVEGAKDFAANPNVSAITLRNLAKAKAAPVVIAKKAEAPAPAKAMEPVPNAQRMLLYWWQQASASEREAFLKKIKKAP